MDTDTLIRQLQSLPSEQQQEVADLVAFLSACAAEEVRTPLETQGTRTDESFRGMWKDREDMTDSAAWVRDTRRREWGT